MDDGGSTLASRRNRKKRKNKTNPADEKRITAASLRGRKDGKDAHQAELFASQLDLTNPEEDDEESSTDIGDLSHLSGAMLKAHRKELASRKKKVWKKKKKKKRDPDPNLVFDPFELKRSESFSECRLCLDPGALRGCCGGYYCNKCFYKTDFCPGCDTSVKSLVMATNDSLDPTKNTYSFMEFTSLFRGFIAKIGVYSIVLGVPFSIVYGFLLEPPKTLHGYTCSGFMPSCEIELCSNFLSHIDQGTSYYDTTGQCENGYDGHCVCSLGCVYDNYLYTRTNGHLGLDYCTASFNSWSIVMQDHFDEGSFDPIGWSEIKNARPSTLCNADSANASLVFQGEVVYRSATTIDLNVEYGAKVEFRLRYGNDKGCVDCCQDLYSPGVVTLSLSNNGGPFEPFNSYGIHDYKKDTFTLVNEIIPSEYLSKNTKFKWHQDRFAGYRDTWALDNVTILAQSLPNGWKDSDKWIDQKNTIQTKIEKYACCYGSDLCNHNTAKAMYKVDENNILHCIQNIDDFPSTVKTSKTTLILSGNETSGITTSKKISYHNNSATIIVSNPTSWLKNDGSYNRRNERADDATYAITGCMILYFIRCIYLNAQKKCPFCNLCKRWCCENKRKTFKTSKEKLHQEKRKDNQKMGQNFSSSSSSNEGIELTEVIVKGNKVNNKINNKANNKVNNQRNNQRNNNNNNGRVGSAVVVQSENTTTTNSDDDSDDDDVANTLSKDDNAIIETSIVEFPVIISRKWLCFFLTVTWIPVLCCITYVGLFIAPAMTNEIRILTVPTSFAWKTNTIDSIIDYRNIHKGVVPKKEIDPENEEEVSRGYGQDWERLWKFPSRFITTTVEVPMPRIITIIFAIVLDTYIVYQLSKQIRMDELFRPLLMKINNRDTSSSSCCWMNIRSKFKLNLFHHSGEMMDIPNTLLMDHLIYDDLPLHDEYIEFNFMKQNRIGSIQLKRISSVIGVSNVFSRWIAFSLIFTCIPFGCLTILLPDSRFILPRIPSIACGCLFAMRCLGGPLVYIDTFFLFNSFTSFNAFRYWTLSTHIFRSYCLKGGLFCMFIGILAGSIILGLFNIATWNTGAFVELWIPWMIVSSGMFLIIGFIFGCRKRMSTRLIPILTSLGNEKPGTLISFTQIERCTCCHSNMIELCIQEECLLVYMDDARELDQWLKVQYLLE